jgi:hypothetical protein
MAKKVTVKKVTAEKFVELFLQKFSGGTYVDKNGIQREKRGVHVVYDGFNATFGEYYGLDKEGVRAALDKLVEAGKIEIRPAKGGAILYRAGEAPAKRTSAQEKAQKILAEMGL